ncbi:excalibur calcium-binding domain-containing protein [Streptomyces sp. NBC_00390]|uniref:excalibur calcium-binding domain-containing protein n=1 Tax=Streptomyces sp. NBC_00390 TaxID=2975736 RepID=UPI003FCC364C
MPCRRGCAERSDEELSGRARVGPRDHEAVRIEGGANCTAVRAAGAAPIRTGDPGYGRHLDRDGDGVACE